MSMSRALLTGGADAEASGGSIGTPLDNAIGYGCWHVAELLAATGVRVDKLWHAAALGRLDRIEGLLAASSGKDEISQAFWHACAASQWHAAERLLAAGTDLNWPPEYAVQTPLDAASGKSTGQQTVIEWLRKHDATSANQATTHGPDVAERGVPDAKWSVAGGADLGRDRRPGGRTRADRGHDVGDRRRPGSACTRELLPPRPDRRRPALHRGSPPARHRHGGASSKPTLRTERFIDKIHTTTRGLQTDVLTVEQTC